jgi:2-oxoglutarate ferredoxin oxidoreductase subunit alpha
VPPLEVIGDPEGVLLLAWGSTFGPVREAVGELLAQGCAVAHAHLRYLHPLPAGLTAVVRRSRAVLVVELNEGQLAAHLRGELGISVHTLSRLGGAMFSVADIVNAVQDLVRQLASEGA